MDTCIPPLLDQNFSQSFHQTPLLQHYVDLGLMSCTESLGFESSDEISSLDCESNFGCSYRSSSGKEEEDCSSSSPSSSSNYPSNSSYLRSRTSSIKRWSETKKDFPPPLTTINQRGRRSFELRSERKNGRLEIVKVEIERPEFLYASRQNGRLTMHFVIPDFEQNQEEEEETETEDEEEEVREEEKREWNIPATSPTSVQRCYRSNHVYVWGLQQRRSVTIM